MKIPVIRQDVLDGLHTDCGRALDVESHLRRMNAIDALNPLLGDQIRRESTVIGPMMLKQGSRLEAVIAAAMWSVVMLLDDQMEADALDALLGPAPE